MCGLLTNVIKSDMESKNGPIIFYAFFNFQHMRPLHSVCCILLISRNLILTYLRVCIVIYTNMKLFSFFERKTKSLQQVERFLSSFFIQCIQN